MADKALQPFPFLGRPDIRVKDNGYLSLMEQDRRGGDPLIERRKRHGPGSSSASESIWACRESLKRRWGLTMRQVGGLRTIGPTFSSLLLVAISKAQCCSRSYFRKFRIRRESRKFDPRSSVFTCLIFSQKPREWLGGYLRKVRLITW